MLIINITVINKWALKLWSWRWLMSVEFILQELMAVLLTAIMHWYSLIPVMVISFTATAGAWHGAKRGSIKYRPNAKDTTAILAGLQEGTRAEQMITGGKHKSSFFFGCRRVRILSSATCSQVAGWRERTSGISRRMAASHSGRYWHKWIACIRWHTTAFLRKSPTLSGEAHVLPAGSLNFNFKRIY